MSRIVSWFSCGVASAIATKIAINEYKDVNIVNCKIDSEHPDSSRFLKDCEKWYNQKITILQSEKYKDNWDVYDKTNYLNGPHGARCTVELKKVLRYAYKLIDDIQIFGYTIEEKKRVKDFSERYPEINAKYPLIEHGLTHAECLGLINEIGIDIPEMYKLGYNHNNCIGCVKGGIGYWNKIRVDFPEAFDKMSNLERKLNYKLHDEYLDELSPGRGDFKKEKPITCDFMCQIELKTIDRGKINGK